MSTRFNQAKRHMENRASMLSCSVSSSKLPLAYTAGRVMT